MFLSKIITHILYIKIILFFLVKKYINYTIFKVYKIIRFSLILKYYQL